MFRPGIVGEAAFLHFLRDFGLGVAGECGGEGAKRDSEVVPPDGEEEAGSPIAEAGWSSAESDFHVGRVGR